jgi:hypothetical protein
MGTSGVVMTLPYADLQWMGMGAPTRAHLSVHAGGRWGRARDRPVETRSVPRDRIFLAREVAEPQHHQFCSS